MSYTKKAKKGYYGIAEYRDQDGKRHQKSVGCFKLKREALTEASKLEKELASINVVLKDITLVDYFKRWLSYTRLIRLKVQAPVTSTESWLK